MYNLNGVLYDNSIKDVDEKQVEKDAAKEQKNLEISDIIKGQVGRFYEILKPAMHENCFELINSER